jgi:hypothetical protein
MKGGDFALPIFRKAAKLRVTAPSGSLALSCSSTYQREGSSQYPAFTGFSRL